MIPPPRTGTARLRPFETLLIVTLLASLPFMIRSPYGLNYLSEFFFFQICGLLSIGYLMMLAYFVLLLCRHRDLGKSVDILRDRYFSLPFLADFLRVAVACSLLMLVYYALRQTAPLIHRRLFDPTLWRTDLRIHLGLSPSLLALKIPPEAWLWPFMDRLYAAFPLVSFSFPCLFILQQKSRTLADRAITAFFLLWIVGGFVHLLLPAMGPCYYKAGAYEGLAVPKAKALQSSLVVDYVRFVGDPAAYAEQLRFFRDPSTTIPERIYFGIAAMPAMQVAVPLLLALCARALHPALAAAALGYALLTFLGGVMLGWHYAVDGYAGALLALLTYFVSFRYVQGRPKLT